MKIFLTGYPGFLATHIFERLTKDDICIFSRGEDVRRVEQFQPDVIYHCAGEIYKESEMFDSNITLTYRLLEQARKVKNLKAFIYIGSSSEYGRKDHPMSEQDFLDPSNLYEATKGAGSLLCQAYARSYGVPAIVARPFSLYGKHEPKHRLIPTLIKSARAGLPVSLAPGVHDFIHVDDFINGLFCLADDPKPGEVFNFGTGHQYTNEQVCDMVEHVVGRSMRRTYVEKMHEYDTDMWRCDTTKVLKFWKPFYNLEEGLKQCLT